jgi:uracil-DNA glycosylase
MGRVGKDLEAWLCAEVELGKEFYPAIESVFKCLCHLEAGDVRAVILGQDPYHQRGQATGRAFEVPDGVAAPPSLRNILKLLAKDLGRESSHPGLLAHWESEGVLLLNTVLTVSKGEPESHRNQGWEVITDRLIEAVAQSSTQTVFFLWGLRHRKRQTLSRESRISY